MILTDSTLIDISKYSNKALKIADYMAKAEHLLLFNALVTNINEDSSDIDYILAFHKDLNITVKSLVDARDLLSTVDNNNNVINLNGEQNLTKIFGDKYDSINKELILPFGRIPLKKDLEDDVIKNKILNFIGLDLDSYTTLYKKREVLFSSNKNSLFSDDDKIDYLAQIVSREQFEEPLNEIKNLKAKYSAFRRNLSTEARALVDDKITFQRSMIDSIAKGNTYITAKEGVVQQGLGTKKRNDELVNIHKKLIDHPFIEAVELDKLTNLNHFADFLEQTKRYKFNLPTKAILKSRPLGNYGSGVGGLCIRSENLVAIDYKEPSSTVHELIHLIKLPGQEQIARKFRSKLNLDSFSREKQNYYSSTNEIISRLGEITALLEDYNFNENKETIQEFAVRINDDSQEKYKFNMTKKIDYYLKHSNIYFDLENVEKEDFTLLKEYFRGYMRVSQDLDIKPMPNIPDVNHIPHSVIGKHSRYEGAPINLINANNIINMFERNDQEKIISPAILAETIIKNIFHLDRTRKNLSGQEVFQKTAILQKLTDWIVENDRVIEAKTLLEARLTLDTSINLFDLITIKKGLDGEIKTNLNILNKKDEIIQKANDVMDRHVEILNSSKHISNQNNYSINKQDLYDFKEVKSNYAKEMGYSINDYFEDKNLNNVIFNDPTYLRIKKERENISNISEQKYLENSKMQYYVFAHIDHMANTLIKNNKFDFLKAFDNNDLAPIVLNSLNCNRLAQNSKFSRSVSQSIVLLNKTNPYIGELFTSSGYLDKYNKNKDNVYVENLMGLNEIKRNYNSSFIHSSYDNVSHLKLNMNRSLSLILQKERIKITSTNKVDSIIKSEDLKNLTGSDIVRDDLMKELKTFDYFERKIEDENIKYLLNQGTESVSTANEINTEIKEPEASNGVNKELKSTSQVNTEEKNNNTPIDPNKPIEKTVNKNGRGRPTKNKQENPNQFNLF